MTHTHRERYLYTRCFILITVRPIWLNFDDSSWIFESLWKRCHGWTAIQILIKIQILTKIFRWICELIKKKPRLYNVHNINGCSQKHFYRILRFLFSFFRFFWSKFWLVYIYYCINIVSHLTFTLLLIYI